MDAYKYRSPANEAIKQTIESNIAKLILWGTRINSEWEHTAEIRVRIERANATFYNIRNILIFNHTSITLLLKIRLLHCYIFLIFLV